MQTRMLTETQVQTALRDCFHPQLKLNAVDLGIVERIAVSIDPEAPGHGIAGVPQKHIVALMLLPPTDDDTANAMLTELIRNRLLGIPEIGTVLIESREGWEPGRLTVDASRELTGRLRNDQLVQIKL